MSEDTPLKPLVERLRMLNHCRRCNCMACDRDAAGELHGHICTEGAGCVETVEKLRALNRACIHLAIEAAAHIERLEKTPAPVVGQMAYDALRADISDALGQRVSEP